MRALGNQAPLGYDTLEDDERILIYLDSSSNCNADLFLSKVRKKLKAKLKALNYAMLSVCVCVCMRVLVRARVHLCVLEC